MMPNEVGSNTIQLTDGSKNNPLAIIHLYLSTHLYMQKNINMHCYIYSIYTHYTIYLYFCKYINMHGYMCALIWLRLRR